MFTEEDGFHQNTINLARHLYDSTEHPRIKDGELYVCHYENCIYNNHYVEAMGIYKTENRSRFLDLVYEEDHTFQLTLREGVEISAFDKGCLIFPTNAETGFDVLICDNNKGEEAAFWRDSFLKLQLQATEYSQTNQLLTMTKEFIAKQIPQEFEMDRTDQIDLLNRSLDYFKGNGSFNKEQFEQEVFHEEGMIQSFRQFGESYSEMHDVDLPDQFEISTQAVKKQARVFKSVLKLDSNFHVYIHGDKSLIEKGYDEEVGKHYYKIFFDEES
ncbi:MAG: nucleoid-associated protein [Chitinophagia bacterium]|nr:nucleoid-associated protein [Chitinophagia bacterium]